MSMNFVHDQLNNLQAFRILTVIDNLSRQSVLLKVGFRLNGHSFVEALNLVASKELLPLSITMDHGTELISRALDEWALQKKGAIGLTRPGNPTNNWLCELVQWSFAIRMFERQ